MTHGKDICELKLIFYKNLTISINIHQDTNMFTEYAVTMNQGSFY